MRFSGLFLFTHKKVLGQISFLSHSYGVQSLIDPGQHGLVVRRIDLLQQITAPHPMRDAGMRMHMLLHNVVLHRQRQQPIAAPHQQPQPGIPPVGLVVVVVVVDIVDIQWCQQVGVLEESWHRLARAHGREACDEIARRDALAGEEFHDRSREYRTKHSLPQIVVILKRKTYLWILCQLLLLLEDQRLKLGHALSADLPVVRVPVTHCSDVCIARLHRASEAKREVKWKGSERTNERKMASTRRSS